VIYIYATTSSVAYAWAIATEMIVVVWSFDGEVLEIVDGRVLSENGEDVAA
jgi:hypothetical protein